jgi:hypothetical protein
MARWLLPFATIIGAPRNKRMNTMELRRYIYILWFVHLSSMFLESTWHMWTLHGYIRPYRLSAQNSGGLRRGGKREPYQCQGHRGWPGVTVESITIDQVVSIQNSGLARRPQQTELFFEFTCVTLAIGVWLWTAINSIISTLCIYT